MTRPRITALSLVIAVLAIVIGALIWASGKITLHGQRTIYCVQCRDGAWEGWRCTGALVAGDRYRFLASRSRQEVIFWVVGSNQPSAKYRSCVVKDRDNWKCNPNPDEPVAFINELVHGRPDSSGATPTAPVHAVRKWKWWLICSGLRAFHNADY